MYKIFSDDILSYKELIISEGAPIADVSKRISLDVSCDAINSSFIGIPGANPSMTAPISSP